MKKQKQTNILIATILIAAAVIIATKAYERPFLPGGPFYEPKPETKVQTATSAPKTAPARPQSDKIGFKKDIRQYEITAYCLNKNPMASGLMPYRGAIACPASIPLKTKITIQSDKFINNQFICEDRIGLKYRHGNYIDIWMPDCEIALNFGRQKLLINIDN